MLSRVSLKVVALHRLALIPAVTNPAALRVLPARTYLSLRPAFRPAFQVRSVSYFTKQIEELKESVKEEKDEDLKNALADLERDLKKLEETASYEKVKSLLEKKMQSSSSVGGIMGVAHDISQVTKDVYHTIADSDLAKKTAEELKKMGETASSIPVVNKVASAVKSAAGAITPNRDTAEKVVDKTKETAEKVMDKTKETVGKISDQAKESYRETAGKVMDKTKEAMGKVTDQAKETAENTTGKISDHEKKRELRLAEKKKRQEEHFQSFKEDKFDSQETGKKLESSWDEFRKNDANMKKIFDFQKSKDQSVLGSLFQTIQGSLASMFSPSELEKGIKELESLGDKSVKVDEVFKEMQNYTIPEILESYFSGKKEELKDWASTNAFQVLEKSIDQREKNSHSIAHRVGNIKDLKLVHAKLLDKNPVLVFSFTADQSVAVRDKSGKVIEGKEDEFQSVNYVMSVAKDSSLANKMTEGWKLLDIATHPDKKTSSTSSFSSSTSSKESAASKNIKEHPRHVKNEELGDWQKTLRDMEKRQDEESSNIHSIENTGTWDKDPGLENKHNWNKEWENNKDKLKEKSEKDKEKDKKKEKGKVL